MDLVDITKKRAAETFFALQHDNFRNFLAGQSVSLIGTWMQRTAQQWLVGPQNSFYFCGVASMLLIVVIYKMFGPKRTLKARGY